jgi:hypothetical protein
MAGHLAELIEAVHRATPIATIPPARVRWHGANGDGAAVPEIPGLADAMRRAFHDDGSLQSSGFLLT